MSGSNDLKQTQALESLAESAKKIERHLNDLKMWAAFTAVVIGVPAISYIWPW